MDEQKILDEMEALRQANVGVFADMAALVVLL